MAAQKIYDAAVAVREYQTRDGQTKKQWVNVGAVLRYDDGGMSMILEKWFNPAGIAGDGGVRVSFFEPKQRDGQQSAPQSAVRTPANNGAMADAAATFDGEMDDLPF